MQASYVFLCPACFVKSNEDERAWQLERSGKKSLVCARSWKESDRREETKRKIVENWCVRFLCSTVAATRRGAARPCRSFWHVGGARIRHGDGSIQHQGVVLWGWLAGNTRGLLPLPDGGENVRVFYSTPALDPEVAPYSSILFLRSEGPFSLFEFVKLPVGRQNPLDFSTVFSFSPDIIFFCFVSSTLSRSEF